MGRLVECERCRWLVFREERTCPHCGASRRRATPSAVGAVGLGAALAGCPAQDDGDDSTTIADSAEPAYGVAVTDTDPLPTSDGGDDGSGSGEATVGDESSAGDETATGGMMCVELGALCFDDMMGEGDPFMVPCCDPSAECDVACTNTDPSQCTGSCVVSPG